jgi:hypothetical protein
MGLTMPKIEHLYISEPTTEGGDGLILDGKEGEYFVNDVIIDFGYTTPEKLDENLTTMRGCKAVIRDCRFRKGIKLALCGNGDHPEEDKHGDVLFENCVFSDFGRRAPEAQDGVTVVLRNCVIRNWGVSSRFDVRSFAAWAHSGATIIAENCRFSQDKFWQCSLWEMLVDVVNHIGNDFNDRCLSWRSFIPGVCRGLMATDDGKVVSRNCTKNHWWIRIE